MQKVIQEVRDSLCDLKLAIDGTIVMSPTLRASLDAMYDARIPEKWMKVRTRIQFVHFQKTIALSATSRSLKINDLSFALA